MSTNSSRNAVLPVSALPPEVVRLASVGEVPAYIYSRLAMAGNIAQLRAALPGQAEIFYALKACGQPEMLQTAVARCDGIEVASAAELVSALEAGARQVALSGPVKTDRTLQAALTTEARVTIHVESMQELRRVAEAARLYKTQASVAIRVNRVESTVSGSHRMTGEATAFGVTEAALPEMVAEAMAIPQLEVVGFHHHAVSNCVSADDYAHHVVSSLELSRKWAEDSGLVLQYVNVGGGLGSDPRGDRIDVARLGALLDGLPVGDVRLVFEPGRYVASTAGWYVAEVMDIKPSHAEIFAVVRGGTHHLRLPASWGYSHPFAVVERDEWPFTWERPQVRDEVVTVAGELCTTKDVLAHQVQVPQLRIGDRLVFVNAGAYGWEISHDRFLQHDPPQLLLVD